MDHISDIYKLYQDIQNPDFEEICLLENKKTFLVKNANEENVEKLVDRYWNTIRHKVQTPQNDIDWWIKRPFEEFKEYVNSFDLRNKSQRRQNDIVQDAKVNGAELLGQKDGFEIWYVPTYTASVLLGRDYKNRPSHWCISSDDPEYWYDDYEQSEFIFLIREELKWDDYDKVAIQFEDGGRYYNENFINVWDINDNDDYDSITIPSDMLRYSWELFKDSGLSKQRYY